MRLTCRLRKSISRLLIGTLLFAQFALASYACPGLKVTASTTTSVDAPAEMLAAVSVSASKVEQASMPPGCDQMDPDAPNLCAEHCHQGQQGLETASAPVVNLGFPTLLYSLPLEPQLLLGSGRSFPAPDARLDAAPEPPHAILHCVFRI